MKLFCNLFKPTLAHISTKSKCIIQPKNLPILVSCYISNNIFTDKNIKYNQKVWDKLKCLDKCKYLTRPFTYFKII